MQQLNGLYIREPVGFIMYDVETLYPRIDISDAIKALHDTIPEMRNNCAFWTNILQLIMYDNYVQAGSEAYRQMTGTATGTQVAPPFASLYLYYKCKNILTTPRRL